MNLFKYPVPELESLYFYLQQTQTATMNLNISFRPFVLHSSKKHQT